MSKEADKLFKEMFQDVPDNYIDRDEVILMEILIELKKLNKVK